MTKMPSFRLPALVLIGSLLGSIAYAAPELFVDSHATPGGKGSATSPFQTIADAVKAAPDGGTITIKAGSYRESVAIANKKNKDAPLVIRAAEGERVIVTGFDALQGWKDEGNGLYSLITPDRVNDLYVAGSHQRLARFPDAQLPWAKVTQVDAAAGKVQLDQFPPIPAGEEKSLILCSVGTVGNTEVFYRLSSIDPATKTVSFPPTTGLNPRVGDPGLLINAPSFIKYPGEWTCQQIDDKTWKTIFRPKSADDLQKTETRSIKRPIVFDLANVSNVVFEGLEISSGLRCGINAIGSDHLQIKRCLIYNNSRGIMTDNVSDVLIDSSIIFANHHGVLATQGKNFTLQGCEVALNEEDGIDVCGRGLQDPKAAPFEDVTLRNCYFHGHIYLGHPDNTQSWGNVHGLNYENDLIMLGGNSSGQLEDCDNLKVTNSAMVGSDNYHFNLGIARGLHTDVHDAEFTKDTFAFAGSICINMPKTVHGVKSFRNVFLQNHSIFTGSNFSSGNNLFWAHGGAKDGLVISMLTGKQVEYASLPDFQALDKNYEVGSQKADPQFKNVPVCLLRARGFTTPSNAVTIVQDPGKTFAVGDNIEVNGDGILRKIDSVNGQVITFSPPLPAAPFRDLILWNWGTKTDTQIDLTSPVVGGKDQPGCNINVAAYQRGELDGSGKRSIPTLSPDLKAIMPNPNDFIFPYYLYLQGRFD